MGTIPTAATQGAGAVITATTLNSYRDVLNFALNPPQAYAYANAAQSVATSSATAISLDSELFDVVQSGDSPMHDNVTNNSRMVCRTAGKYELVGQVRWSANATGIREARIRLNGVTDLIKNAQTPAAASSTDCATPPIVVTLAVGDYVELVGLQTSGAALNTVGAREVTFLRARFVAA